MKKSVGKTMAMMLAATVAMAQGAQAETNKLTREVEKVNGSYFVGNTGGFNYHFKTPNQKQKRKYARNNPALRKKWNMKRK